MPVFDETEEATCLSPEVDEPTDKFSDETLADVFSLNVESSSKQRNDAAQVYARAKSLPPIMNQERTEHTKQKKRDLFTHISLTMDKETAKYMPYSGVAFPKLVDAEKSGDGIEENAEVASKSRAELEAMWMVGFLDHERRNEKEAALKDLSHYISLPGGQLLAGVGNQIRKIYKKGDNEAADMDKRLKKMTAGQRRRILGSSTVAARLADEHVLRLKELERTKGGEVEATTLRAARKQAVRRNRSCMHIYKRENKKIRKAFRDRGKRAAAAGAPQAVMRSRALEDLFELERDRLEAVLKIQECWRTYRARQHWSLVVAKSRSVTKIQRCVRGMLARTLVRVWLLRRSWLVIVSQACIRGYLVRKNVRATLRAEQAAVTSVQAVVRGYLARIRADFVRSSLAARSIQRRWRGCVARVMADRMWLNQEVSKMQKIVRGYLGRLRHAAASVEMNEAACIIQRNTRSLFGKWRRNEMLWQRETERRREFIQILRSEDEYHCELRDELIVEMTELLEVDKAVEFARVQWEAMQDQVNEKEFDLLAMQHERAIVDRRAIEQGWTTELDKFVDDHRRWVTNAKNEAIFVGAFYHRTLVARREEMQEKLDELNWQIEQIQGLRVQEAGELFQREAKHEWELNRRERRRRVADQRRKWRVKWYTDDGKVDKKRREGYAWDPRAFAGAERDVFNVGSVNLMAGTMDEDVSGLELITQQVALQNAQNQIVQYGALLKPLFDGMENLTEEVAQLSLRNELEREAREALAAEERAAMLDDGEIDIDHYISRN